MSNENVRIALEYIQTGAWDGRALPSYGDLVVATDAEEKALNALERLIGGYLSEKRPARPLCVAVFGPPGSGKSISVAKIKEKLDGESQGEKRALSTFKLNLTQLSATEQLGDALCEFVKKASDGSVPLVFFDEFDAPLGGAPLGWLHWFLAPMEDGEFVHRGERVELKRAVFVFAGGTAHRAADFGARELQRFRDAKGPDFASRLRGYLDVFGPNDGDLAERCRRRAISIRYQLKALQVTAEPVLLEALLEAARYRHGNRSISAVLELCARSPERVGKTIRLADLPDDALLSLHVDSGPLDVASIGGAIGMSCNFDAQQSRDVMRSVAEELWRQGALIAYFRGHASTDAFSWRPTRTAGTMRNRLSKYAYQALRVELFVFDDVEPEQGANSDSAASNVVVRVPGRGRVAWKKKPELAFEELVRMRWIMNSRCVARVLVEGRTDASAGRRMPGIFEEAMFALVTGQPIYVLGGFGGATQHLGSLLGLATRRRVLPEIKLPHSEVSRSVATFGGMIGLPLHGKDVLQFLTSCAIGGPDWPDNGLTVEENRELFETTDVATITSMIRRGLMRRFGAR